MVERNKFVTFLGLTGSGKTTASEILVNDYGYIAVPEEFAGNPFLEPFYEDMPRWAFHSQLFFLLKKIEQMDTISELLSKRNVVQDFPIYQDIVYAKVHL